MDRNPVDETLSKFHAQRDGLKAATTEGCLLLTHVEKTLKKIESLGIDCATCPDENESNDDNGGIARSSIAPASAATTKCEISSSQTEHLQLGLEALQRIKNDGVELVSKLTTGLSSLQGMLDVLNLDTDSTTFANKRAEIVKLQQVISKLESDNSRLNNDAKAWELELDKMIEESKLKKNTPENIDQSAAVVAVVDSPSGDTNELKTSIDKLLQDMANTEANIASLNQTMDGNEKNIENFRNVILKGLDDKVKSQVPTTETEISPTKIAEMTHCAKDLAQVQNIENELLMKQISELKHQLACVNTRTQLIRDQNETLFDSFGIIGQQFGNLADAVQAEQAAEGLPVDYLPKIKEIVEGLINDANSVGAAAASSLSVQNLPELDAINSSESDQKTIQGLEVQDENVDEDDADQGVSLEDVQVTMDLFRQHREATLRVENLIARWEDMEARRAAAAIDTSAPDGIAVNDLDDGSSNSEDTIAIAQLSLDEHGEGDGADTRTISSGSTAWDSSTQSLDSEISADAEQGSILRSNHRDGSLADDEFSD